MLANLHKLLMPHWLQLQQQTGSNPRLRWMLWGILYIFLIYFALSLGDWRAEQQQSINQLQRTAIKLEQLESQTEWPERWEAEKAVGAQLQARLWKAKSAGLAEADLQNFLRTLMSVHEGESLRLRLAPTEMVTIGSETLIKVSAEVSAMLGVAQIDNLMRAMAEHPRVLVVERFSYSPQRSGVFSMLVTAYFSSAEEVVSQGVAP
ncbi:hypothetical protein D0C16_15915 [Cellvibrio sp. KY-GH-1]|uniref:hypothetical protein n=1 Tax=Cellvibrio sp. KY-GH-1 TaxID=2303332 RepID=UPI00124915D8|nr:hypothetical protein [Cellvibrio sp. KY-GH-1]QEY17335.1 hypothetical protein D0C16_15915 [Cellvibrio sp. KY-GH-1]